MAGCRTILCALHLKGLVTLLLMTLAETVQLNNAIEQHRTTEHHHQHDHHHSHDDTVHQQASCLDSSAATAEHDHTTQHHQTCGSDLDACYQACRSDPAAATLMARNIPRGGHSHSHIMRDAISTVTPYNIPLTAWKIAFQALLTGLNILCWLIPLYGADISADKLSYMNAFSGGVFLSLALCHLIPECATEFTGDNPMIPYMCVLFGYLLIFFVEKIAFADAHDMLHMEHNDGSQHNNNGHSHASHKHGEEKAITDSGNSAVILLAALSVHSILEMMALGLARSFTDSAVLTGSIALHQPAESIALLIAFLKTGKSKREILLFLSAFSLMGPIGVGLGILVQEYAPSQLNSIVLAIVAGTFVYVGATEVIPEEFDHAKHKYKKFSFLLLGIAAILGITQYTMTLTH